MQNQYFWCETKGGHGGVGWGGGGGGRGGEQANFLSSGETSLPVVLPARGNPDYHAYTYNIYTKSFPLWVDSPQLTKN